MKIILVLSYFIGFASFAQTEELKNYISMAKEKMYVKDFQTAEKNLNEALKLDPKSDVVYRLLGTIKYNTERFHEAILDFDKAIEFENPSKQPFTIKGEAYSHRGLCKYELKQYEGAIKDFKIVINFEDSTWNNWAYLWCGQSYLDSGDKSNACFYWEQGDRQTELNDNCR